MVKPDLTRDYYADLELPSGSDIAEVKKQFRKLALKWHPDRNPGRENEVNGKFQIIQSAHEVLTDPDAKSKYDLSRLGRTRRYPTASGVKGNPWQNAAKETGFPPPPSRTNPARPQMPPRANGSGAQRYASMASAVPPKAAKEKEDPVAAEDIWRRWERMRGSHAANKDKSSAKSPQTPSSEQQRGESKASAASSANQNRTTRPRPSNPASFGRRSSYGPRAPTAAKDDTSAQSSGGGYSSSSRTTYPKTTNANRSAASASTSTAERGRRASVSDDTTQTAGEFTPRPRAPYGGLGGERTSLYDGVPIRKTKGARESGRFTSNSEQPSTKDGRERSASAPHKSYESETDGTAPRSTTSAEARTSRSNSPASNQGEQETDKANRGPKLYEIPPFPSVNPQVNPPQMNADMRPSHDIPPLKRDVWAQNDRAFEAYFAWYDARQKEKSTSGGPLTASAAKNLQDALKALESDLNAFEARQFSLVDRLVKRRTDPSEIQTPLSAARQRMDQKATPIPCTNTALPNRFSFTSDHIPKPPPNQARMSTSFDNINTRFVEEETARFEFSAGQGSSNDSDRPRARTRTQSATRFRPRRPMQPSVETDTADSTGNESPGTKFDASQWDGFGPQTFAPAPSTSPTRLSRSSTRKARPVRRTMGTAGLVPEDSTSDSEGQAFSHSRRAAQAWADASGAESPNAMDIDPPASEPPKEQAAGARNIPVEPSRPEWRAGDVDGMSKAAAAAAAAETPRRAAAETPRSAAAETPRPAAAEAKPRPKNAGSEDTDEFFRSFADLKQVDPIKTEATGINSFADLKSTLPFESRAAPNISLGGDKAKAAPVEVALPPAPVAPRPPPTLAISGMKTNLVTWTKYVGEFKKYMAAWDEYNAQFLAHFNARKETLNAVWMATQYSPLDAVGNSALRDYQEALRFDREVRAKWTLACDEHEKRVQEFMGFKNRMAA